MKKNQIALISALAALAFTPTAAQATDAADFGVGGTLNANFGTAASNGGVAIGAGYSGAPTNGLIVQCRDWDDKPN